MPRHVLPFTIKRDEWGFRGDEGYSGGVMTTQSQVSGVESEKVSCRRVPLPFLGSLGLEGDSEVAGADEDVTNSL